VNMDAIRQRQSATEGESSADIEYLDEDEQKELISKMAGQNDRTNRFFRDIFTAGSLLFGLVKVWYMSVQCVDPSWAPFPHSLFKDILSSKTIILFEAASTFSFLLSGYFCSRISLEQRCPEGTNDNAGKRRCLWLSIAIEVPVIFYLCLICLIRRTLYTLDFFLFFWFVGINLLYNAACWYVDYAIRDSDAQIKSMYKLVYAFKKP
jgi:hypothetical protein